MAPYLTSITVLSILLSFSGCLANDGICTKPENGSMSSCFNPKRGQVTLDMRWSPQHIAENQNYTVTILQLDAPEGISWNDGNVHVTVWIPGLEPKPLYNKSLPYSCADLLKELPAEFQLFVSCPLKVPTLPLPLTIPLPLHTPPQIPVPMGSYRIRLEVYEGKEETDEPFICLDGWLIFAKVDKSENADCVSKTPTEVTPEENNDLKFHPVHDAGTMDSHDLL